MGSIFAAHAMNIALLSLKTRAYGTGDFTSPFSSASRTKQYAWRHLHEKQLGSGWEDEKESSEGLACEAHNSVCNEPRALDRRAVSWVSVSRSKRPALVVSADEGTESPNACLPL